MHGTMSEMPGESGEKEVMMAGQKRASKLKLSDLGKWLRQGWAMFIASSRISMVYAAIPFIFGTALQAGLAGRGYGLVYFLFATGFLIVAPIFSILYYQIADVLGQGGKPGWGEFITTIRRTPLSVWAVGMVLAALYLIWITDALIIYSVYFSFDPIAFQEYFSNGQVSGDAASFVFYVTVLGLVLSFVTFVIAAFSIPHGFHAGAGFVNAVVFSVSNIFRNFNVLMTWACILAIAQAFTLLVFMPLGLLTFPVLAFANAAAYRQLREHSEAATA